MSKKMFAGSGLFRIDYDREKKLIRLNFSGNDEDNTCFRNDASILFFVSNSYCNAYHCLERELKSRFENNTIKDIGHIILPYFFNFRHFVELELKALIVAITNQSPKLTHDLDSLLVQVENSMNEITFESIENRFPPITEEGFNKSKSEAQVLLVKLKKLMDQYVSTEYAVEYYRYIFENDKGSLILNNPTIELDFENTRCLFQSIVDTFGELRMKLREIIYIQSSF